MTPHSLDDFSPTNSGNAALMRRLNRSSVLDLLRQASPISPTEIASRLNLSLPTVMRILEELARHGLVLRLEEQQYSGGRPRSLVSFNGTSHAVIGLDLGGTKMYGTVADLCGTIQAEVYRASVPSHPDENLNLTIEMIEELLQVPRREGQKVLGIGVGAPGVTLFDEGIVIWAPSLGWRDLPLRDLLAQRFGLEVVVENDVNLAALGEYGFGVAKGASSLVCLAVGTGIGSGIVLDRKIYRGYHQSAGEVGYLLPCREALGKRYEHFGALESLASGTGVVQRAQELIRARGLAVELESLTAEKVFDLARSGVDWAQALVDETVDYLALVIAAISVVLDPEVIVLGGGVSRSADVLVEPILNRLQGCLPAPVRLVVSNLGYRAAVMGAIMLVLDTSFEHINLRST
ncbi:MAG: ROK family transcriptional regulator [Anaerolineales bacterium]|nr:ROK family transcriptional regulator [Anaerolineales bacterium]MDW8162149.1 ROK family transcriptional regulator [Anaerolineales bacterium]